MKWQEMLNSNNVEGDFLNEEEILILIDRLDGELGYGVLSDFVDNEYAGENPNSQALHAHLSKGEDYYSEYARLSIFGDGTIYLETETSYETPNGNHKYTHDNKDSFDNTLTRILHEWNNWRD